MNRREFAKSTAMAGGFLIAGGMQRAWSERPDQAKRDRIAIMSRSFNPVLKYIHPSDPSLTLDVLDLPGMIAERYGVHHVEFQHTDFASTEPEYLDEIKDRMAKAGSTMNQINLEFRELNISTPDDVLRLETIDLTKKWVDHAAALGCARLMVNQGTLSPEVRPAAIDALKKINAYAKTKSVLITLENKDTGGHPKTPRAPWEVVVEVIKEAGIWANPDVGNFPDDASRAAGLRALYPLSSGSSHCHYAPARYSEADAIAISKQCGYRGLYSIEAEVADDGPDPYVAVETIVEELLRDI